MKIYQVWESIYYDYDDGGPDALLGSFIHKKDAILLRNKKAKIIYDDALKINDYFKGHSIPFNEWVEIQNVFYIGEIEVK